MVDLVKDPSPGGPTTGAPNVDGEVIFTDMHNEISDRLGLVRPVTSRVIVTDASGFYVVSAITTTKLGFLTDVTSNIQAQLDGKASTAHKDTHKTGGSDAFTGADLLDGIARVTVRKNTGADVGSRRRLNFIEGANITLTIADDAVGEEVDITITGPAGGGSEFTDNLFRITDDGDTSKKIAFQAAAIATATTRTISMIDADLTILGLTNTQSPTNKTFDNTNTFTIRDDRLTLQDNVDTTKQLLFQLSGIATGTTRTLTAPNADGTIALVGHTHVLTDVTDVTITVANLNSLDDGVNSTLHFHNSDRDRANHTGTQDKSTITGLPWAKADIPATTVYTDQANVFGDFNQTFKDNRILIESPDGLTPVTIINSQQTLARNLTIPILTGNRNFVVTGESNQIGDAEITAHTSTKITITAKGQLNSNIVYTDQANVMGDFDFTLKDNRLRIENPAGTFEVQLQTSAEVADRILTIPLLGGDRSIIVTGVADQITNTEIAAHTSTKITITAKGQLNTAIVYNDQTNAFGDFEQSFKDNQLKIFNPADTFKYVITAGAITAERILNLPVITGTDTIAVLSLAQTFLTGGKTFNDNILKVRNPADTFSYSIRSSAIVADRDAILPVLTANSTFAFADFANAWGTQNQNIAATGKWQEAGVSISPIGVHDIFIPASSMWPSTTGGSQAINKREVVSGIDIQSLNFDQAASESAQWTMKLPRNWNNGTITFEVDWTAAAGTGTVTWSIKAFAVSNDDTINTTYGTAVAVTDTLLAANDEHLSPTSAALTIGGTPADSDLLHFQILRDIADTLNADAELLGVWLHFTLDAAVAA